MLFSPFEDGGSLYGIIATQHILVIILSSLKKPILIELGQWNYECVYAYIIIYFNLKNTTILFSIEAEYVS